MTRHDRLVETAAPYRKPKGWFAPGAPPTIIMHANLINSVAADAQTQARQLLPGRRVTPFAAAHDRHSRTPKRKTP